MVAAASAASAKTARRGAGARDRGKGTAMMVRLDRREVLAASGGALATVAFGAMSPAQAANDSGDLIKKFTGGKATTEGKVKLDLPEIAENGNTVPMTMSVESPMTEQSYVTEVLVVAAVRSTSTFTRLASQPSPSKARVPIRQRACPSSKYCVTRGT